MSTISTYKSLEISAPTAAGLPGDSIIRNFMRLAGVVGTSIEAYGAKGDDDTDNTVAFQDAVDTVSAGGGGIVLIPEGIFQTQCVYLREGVEILGASRKKSIIKRKYLGNTADPPGGIYQGDFWPGDVTPDAALMYAFIAADPNGNIVANASIRNLTIDGNGGSFSDMNIDVNPSFSYDNLNDLSCTGLFVEGIDSINAPSDLDLSVTNNYARSACFRITSVDTVVTDSYFYGAAYNCLSVDGSLATNFRITHCTIGSGRRAGLQIEYGGGNYIVSDNYIFNDWTGIGADVGFGSPADNVPATLVNASYNHTTGAITLTNAFKNYTWALGHRIYITGGTGFTRGYYPITSRTNANTIVISGGPTADAANVGGYLSNSGCAVVNSGASHALYFHGTPQGIVDGNRCVNNSSVGGAAIAFFGDVDGNSDDRSFKLVNFTNNYFESANGPCLQVTSIHVHGVTFAGNTFFKSNTAANCVQWSSDDPSTPTNGVKFLGNNFEQQTASDVAVFTGIEGLVFADNYINKTTTGNNGINLVRCVKPTVRSNTWIGPGGGTIAILISPSGGVQCSDVTIDNNYFKSGWAAFATVNSATLPLDSATVTNNSFGTMSQVLQSFVTGKTTTWPGKDTPTKLVVFGNTGTAATDHASGTATVPSGSSSITVSHGLASGSTGKWRLYTVNDITLRPTSKILTATNYTIEMGDGSGGNLDTQFTIKTFNAAGTQTNVTGNFSLAWSMNLKQS